MPIFETFMQAASGVRLSIGNFINKFTMAEKHPITLAVIVGNESAVIERFIRSFHKVTDRMVFCRATGASEPDDTLEIIKRTCFDLKITLQICIYTNENINSEIPHVDSFARARQMAWDMAATSRPKFIMWADADDIITPESAAKIKEEADTATEDVLIVPYNVKGDKQIVMRERLVRCDPDDRFSRWRYSIHEQLEFLRPVKYRMVSDASIVHSPLETKSGSHERNMTLLQMATRDVARNFFYLHQECFQQNQVKRAKQYGNQALNCPDLETLERYEILLNLAQLEDGPEAKNLAVMAFSLMPDRREALALLANYAIIDGNYEKAHQFARIMVGIGKPKRSYWSLNNDWYGWKGAELYMQCQRLIGEDWSETESLLREGKRPMFSILHATLGRPAKALAIREMWLSAADNPRAVEYIFGLHEGDDDSLRILKGFSHTVCAKGIGCPTNYDTAAGIARGTIIIQAQDDCYPPQGWDTMLLAAIKNPNEPAFVAVSDGQRGDRLCVNSIMTRSYMIKKSKLEDEGNGFMHREYPAVFADTENTYRAYKDAQDGYCNLIEAKHIVIYHDHPHFNQSVPWDETYKWENSDENYRKGREIFLRRNPEAATDGILTL